MTNKDSGLSPRVKTPPRVNKQLTMDDYLAQGKVGKKLYNIVNNIAREDKKARVIDKLHRRIAARGQLPDL